jgi:hypothetical protein
LPAIDHILILRDGIARLYGTRDEVLGRLDPPRSITPEQKHLANEAAHEAAHIAAQVAHHAHASVARNSGSKNKQNPELAGAA